VFQSVETENFSRYCPKEVGDIRGDGKAQTMQPQFTIYHDQLQASTSDLSGPAHCAAVTEPEGMELHPSVTAAFVPETFNARSEICDDINTTGCIILLSYYLYSC